MERGFLRTGTGLSSNHIDVNNVTNVVKDASKNVFEVVHQGRQVADKDGSSVGFISLQPFLVSIGLVALCGLSHVISHDAILGVVAERLSKV